MTGSAQNRLWNPLTSAVAMETRLLPVFGFWCCFPTSRLHCLVAIRDRPTWHDTGLPLTSPSSSTPRQYTSQRYSCVCRPAERWRHTRRQVGCRQAHLECHQSSGTTPASSARRRHTPGCTADATQ